MTVGRVEFANPYHDERGRFARKGEGRRVPTKGVEDDGGFDDAALPGRTVAEALDALPSRPMPATTSEVVSDRAAIAANRDRLIAETGETGRAVVAGVEAWTSDNASVRAGIEAGDETMTRFRDAVAAAPKNPTALHRPIAFTTDEQYEVLTGLQEGDVLQGSRVTSFTTSTGSQTHGARITIAPGKASAMPISKISTSNEHLVAHDLRVVAVNTTRTMNQQRGVEDVFVEIQVEEIP